MKTTIYAIGDIHGRLDLLEPLYERILAHAARHPAKRRVLVHLGDYVDRGPDSKGVIERVQRGLPGFENICLKGNHEALMLDYLNDVPGTEFWLDRGMGGVETLASYGVRRSKIRDLKDAAESVGATHLAWLGALQISHREGGFFFVHAGVMPGVPLDSQEPEHMLWIRDRFLRSNEDFGLRIVHGHTPVDEPEIKRNRIGIDLGSAFSGVLGCAVLDPADPDANPEVLRVTGEPTVK